MIESIPIFWNVILIILILGSVNYLKNYCPKCNRWHPFRFGLIILDKPSEKDNKEWVRCKKCGYDWEKIKKYAGNFDSYGGGGE